MQEKINSYIDAAFEELRESRPLLLKQENNNHERTIAAHFSNYLSKFFPEYNVDTDFHRMTDENGMQIPKRINLNPNSEDKTLVYPDIIVHREENSNNNHLIIEIKMNWKNARKDQDLIKLEAFVNELNYDFGLYLEFGEETIVEKQWFSN